MTALAEPWEGIASTVNWTAMSRRGVAISTRICQPGSCRSSSWKDLRLDSSRGRRTSFFKPCSMDCGVCRRHGNSLPLWLWCAIRFATCSRAQASAARRSRDVSGLGW